MHYKKTAVIIEHGKSAKYMIDAAWEHVSFI